MDSDFNLKEWHDFKSQIVRRSTNTNMRRFSASNLKSFREDERCSRTAATTISSTVSSPGYTTSEKIDPSTYSFTAALKGALQTRNACSWEHPQSEKLTLHSKWSDAEKYISNPLSGEVPLECLSAKTLGARSFRTLTNRITISAPLLYPSHHHHFPAKSPIIQHHHKLDAAAAAQERKMKSTTRDVGIQSVPPEDVGSGSRSPSTPGTPSIRERSVKYSEGESGDSSLSAEKEKVEEEEKEEVVDDERERKEKEGRKSKGGERKKMIFMMRMCSSSSSSSQGEGRGRRRRRGCLSLKGLWQREKCNPKINN